MNRSLFVLISCLLPSISLLGNINQNNDVQLWLTESFHKTISPSFAFHVNNELRFGDQISKLYFIYIQGIGNIKTNDWSELGAGYRQIWNLQETKWRLIYEPLAEVIFHKKRKNLELQMRNRFSYLFREAESDISQYRGRIRIMHSWTAKDKLFQSHLSNEIFIQSQYGFNQDRLVAGIIIPFLDQLNGDFYYMIRFLRTETEFTHQHILGAWFNFYF